MMDFSIGSGCNTSNLVVKDSSSCTPTEPSTVSSTSLSAKSPSLSRRHKSVPIGYTIPKENIVTIPLDLLTPTLSPCKKISRRSSLQCCGVSVGSTRSSKSGKNKSKSFKKENSRQDQLSRVSRECLLEQGFTKGLIQSLEKNKKSFPYNLWIIDNSISMTKKDGHRIDTLESGIGSRIMSSKFSKCTRWEEIQQTIDYHAQMAAILLSPTSFEMINEPNDPSLPQSLTVAVDTNVIHQDLAGNKIYKKPYKFQDLQIAQESIHKLQPTGVSTPISHFLRSIRADLSARISEIQGLNSNSEQPQECEKNKHEKNKNQPRIVVVIATDGIPTTGSGTDADTVINDRQIMLARNELVDTIKTFQDMPIRFVLRLCTDDKSALTYWNNAFLDNNVGGKLNVAVIDDYVSDAKLVYRHNKWLNYGLPLHRLREMGWSIDTVELLTVRSLTWGEIFTVLRFLFGRSTMSPAIDLLLSSDQPNSAAWENFCSYLEKNILEEEKYLWNPIKKRAEPWININELRKLNRMKANVGNNSNNKTTTVNDELPKTKNENSQYHDETETKTNVGSIALIEVNHQANEQRSLSNSFEADESLIKLCRQKSNRMLQHKELVQKHVELQQMQEEPSSPSKVSMFGCWLKRDNKWVRRSSMT